MPHLDVSIHSHCSCLLAGVRLPSFPQHTISVGYATEHRCGVCVRGPGLTDAVTGTDPLKDRLPLLTAQPEDETAEVGMGGAGLLERASHMAGTLSCYRALLTVGVSPA